MESPCYLHNRLINDSFQSVSLTRKIWKWIWKRQRATWLVFSWWKSVDCETVGWNYLPKNFDCFCFVERCWCDDLVNWIIEGISLLTIKEQDVKFDSKILCRFEETGREKIIYRKSNEEEQSHWCVMTVHWAQQNIEKRMTSRLKRIYRMKHLVEEKCGMKRLVHLMILFCVLAQI